MFVFVLCKIKKSIIFPLNQILPATILALKKNRPFIFLRVVFDEGVFLPFGLILLLMFFWKGKGERVGKKIGRGRDEEGGAGSGEREDYNLGGGRREWKEVLCTMKNKK